MDETLKKLLDAELHAEKVAKQAEDERDKVLEKAWAESRAEEERFDARMPEMYASFLGKAEERAEQTVSELKKRFDERHTQLRNLAEEREEDALEAAFKLLVDAAPEG